MLANLPTVGVTSLIAYNVIHASFALAIGAAALLIVLDVSGWRFASMTFASERLIHRRQVAAAAPDAERRLPESARLTPRPRAEDRSVRGKSGRPYHGHSDGAPVTATPRTATGARASSGRNAPARRRRP